MAQQQYNDLQLAANAAAAIEGARALAARNLAPDTLMCCEMLLSPKTNKPLLRT
jgi:hypothetical protein